MKHLYSLVVARVVVLLMDKILHDPKDPNYGNYGIFLIMGNAGFCPSAVVVVVVVVVE